MTFRTKLILWYSSLLAIIIIIFGIGIFAVLRIALINAIDNTLEETADQVIANISESPVGIAEFGGRTTLFVQMPELDLFRASSVYVQVWEGVENEPRLAGASQNLEDFVESVDQTALGLTEDHYSNVVIHDIEGRVLTRPVFFGERLIGNVQVAASLSTVNQATERFVIILAASLVVAVIASVGLGMWLSTRALRPIHAITDAAARIAVAKDLSTRLEWNGPMDELGRLSSVFNRMMTRLEQLFEVQQRFVANVSHELRTPLTVIRGNFETIERYGMEADLADAINSETQRMTRMVEDLLLLAKADYGGLTLEMEAVDLDTIVSEAYREARALVKNRDLAVLIGDFEPVQVAANADRIKQLLLNLVSNAIKFTPDGGQIILNLRHEQGKAILQVQDTGIGIGAQDLKHIFDRFYQADVSRTRNGEGSGLGLSIAKWIAEAHGGEISAESIPGESTTFTIVIPVLDAPAQKATQAEAATNGHTLSKPQLGQTRFMR